MERAGVPEHEIYANAAFMREGHRYMRKWLDEDPTVLNVDRVFNSEKAPPYLYVCNHTSMLDYFVPLWVILNESLPYPRSIVGNNLLNYFVKTFMWDFEKWGVIGVERDGRKKSERKAREYYREVEGTLKGGGSVLVFPEAGRNREPEMGMKEFEHDSLRIPIRVQRKMEENIKLVCMAVDYTKIPEKDYWKKIDGKGFCSKSYFFWDMFAYKRHSISRNKGKAFINFSEPISLKEIQGEGSLDEKIIRVSNFARNGIAVCQREIEQVRFK